MNKKKTLAFFLACSVTASFAFASLASCSDAGEKKESGTWVKLYEEGMKYTETTKGTPEAVYKLAFDCIGGDEVMPIGTYWGPYASGGSVDGNETTDFSSEEIIKGFADCGVNLIVHSQDTWIDGSANTKLRSSMALYEKYGMGYFVRVDYVNAQIGEFNSDVDLSDMSLTTDEGVEQLRQTLNDILYDPVTGEKNDCIVGLYGRDEPFTSQIDNFAVVTDAFYNKLGGVDGLHVYGNLLGYWEDENNLFGYSDPLLYDEYLSQAMNSIKLPMLSVTMYPYTSANTPETSMSAVMYDHLSVYRKYAEQYQIPMWRMLQAGGQWNDAMAWIPSVDPYPSEGETLFDVNLALAYGAKAIQYFPGVQPPWFAYEEGGTYDYNRCGLYGADGNKTMWYYFAQRANAQVAAVDEYLMNAANVGVIVHGDSAEKAFVTDSNVEKNEIIASKKFRELTKVTGDDCVIGCFDYKGGTALYVVNYNRTDKADVTLTFDREDYRYKVIQRASACDVIGEKMTLTLDAGEGALVVLY